MKVSKEYKNNLIYGAIFIMNKFKIINMMKMPSDFKNILTPNSRRMYIIFSILGRIGIYFFSFQTFVSIYSYDNPNNMEYSYYYDFHFNLNAILLEMIIFIVILCLLARKMVETPMEHRRSFIAKNKFLWIRAALWCAIPGEMVFFTITLLYFSPLKLPLFGTWSVFYIYWATYLAPNGRYTDFMYSCSYLFKDWIILIFIALLYALISIGVFIAIFKLAYDRKVFDSKNLILYNQIEYFSIVFIARYIMSSATNYCYINNLEIPLILINTFLTLFVPALVLRLYLKKLGWDGELDGNKNFVAKNLFKWMIGGEIMCMILSLTVFGEYTLVRYGKALAYPAYILFVFLYGKLTGRYNVIADGGIEWFDYLALLVCYIIYIIAFFTVVYILINRKNYFQQKRSRFIKF